MSKKETTALLPALFGLGKKSEDTEHFTGDVYVKEISGFEKGGCGQNPGPKRL